MDIHVVGAEASAEERAAVDGLLGAPSTDTVSVARTGAGGASGSAAARGGSVNQIASC